MEVKTAMKKLITLGVMLALIVTIFANIQVVPIPMGPKFKSPVLSTRGNICRFSALYFDAGASILQGIVGGGNLGQGVGSGVGWLQNGMSTNQWGPANPYNCPP
jgi:hypothetical protein